ncbi:MAG: GGDEF domain-containing protein [Proteobacteria bacterium]|nr:GGDEF domain-containing protein [Pseudomonadota bacterium]
MSAATGQPGFGAWAARPDGSQVHIDERFDEFFSRQFGGRERIGRTLLVSIAAGLLLCDFASASFVSGWVRCALILPGLTTLVLQAAGHEVPDPWRRVGLLAGALACAAPTTLAGAAIWHLQLAAALLAVFALSDQRPWQGAAAGALLATAALALGALAGQPLSEAFASTAWAVPAAFGVGFAECEYRSRWARTIYSCSSLLRKMADRDGLTGIANRRSFDADFDRVWRQARRDKQSLVVAFVDVDGFHDFNERRGPLTGDECLRQLAGAIVSCARRPLDIAARFGGDEFAVVWYSAGREAARILTKRLEDAITTAEPGRGPRGEAGVRVHIGAAVVVPDRDDSAIEALALADAALERAADSHRPEVLTLEDEGTALY